MSTGITNVEPIALPDAAGILFAGGDVQHPSPTIDAFNAQTIARTTRQLAERDNALARTVNDLVSVVNNKDQFINFPVPPVTVTPGGSTIAGTFRIPPGYEGRVLNAIIASTPFGSARLDILYSEGTYGNLTGATELVSTLSEFTTGTSFKRSGEFIVRYNNTSGRAALVTASVMLTLRPVGAQKGGIIGPGAVGAQGPAGVKGDKGDPGSPGIPGGSGPAGLNWRGEWNVLTTYAIRDAVRHVNAAYYALAANLGQTPPAPELAPSAFWDLVAYGPQGLQGTQGDQGEIGVNWAGTWASGSVYTFNDAVYYPLDQNTYISIGAVNTGTAPVDSPYYDRLLGSTPGPEGPVGPPGFVLRGSYDAGETYDANDVVSYQFGSITRTFAASTDVPVATPPGGPGPWVELFGPSTGAFYDVNSGLAPSVTGVGYAAGTAAQGYEAPSAGSNYDMPWQEIEIFGGPAGQAYSGVGFLKMKRKLVFNGPITVNLPTSSDGAALEWTNDDVSVNAILHGTYSGTTGITVEDSGTGAFTVQVHSPEPSKVYLSVAGQRGVEA